MPTTCNSVRPKSQPLVRFSFLGSLSRTGFQKSTPELPLQDCRELVNCLSPSLSPSLSLSVCLSLRLLCNKTHLNPGPRKPQVLILSVGYLLVVPSLSLQTWNSRVTQEVWHCMCLGCLGHESPRQMTDDEQAQPTPLHITLVPDDP